MTNFFQQIFFMFRESNIQKYTFFIVRNHIIQYVDNSLYN